MHCDYDTCDALALEGDDVCSYHQRMEYMGEVVEVKAQLREAQLNR